MQDLTEKTLDSREVYNGRIIQVRGRGALPPGADTACGEVVDHPGGVGILGPDGQGRVALVRQYRYAVESTCGRFRRGSGRKRERAFLKGGAEGACRRWVSGGGKVEGSGGRSSPPRELRRVFRPVHGGGTDLLGAASGRG